MQTFAINDKDSRKTIYTGRFSSVAACVEAALNDGVSMAGADLRGLSLAHANLDGGDFRGALLDGADLVGANLSECDLTGASLRQADLGLAALCESRLAGTDFSETSFLGTLLSEATLESCVFTCPTSLTLPFHETAHLGRNLYGVHAFTTAPVVVWGLPKRIVFLDEVVLLGDDAWPRADFPNPFTPLMAKQESILFCHRPPSDRPRG